MTTRRAALAAFALLALAYWAQPTGAFDAVAPFQRDVAADVVADGSAYLSPSGGTSCVGSRLFASTCTVTLANKGTIAQTVNATKESGASVSLYSIGGSSSASSGPVSTPSEVSVGGTTTLTATVPACLECTGNYDVYWTFEGYKEGKQYSKQTQYKMTITFT